MHVSLTNKAFVFSNKYLTISISSLSTAVYNKVLFELRLKNKSFEIILKTKLKTKLKKINNLTS